jgi:hypothetical protein
MTRQKLILKLDLAWRAFCDSYRGLSDAQLLQSGVVGTWSIKDIIAHVTTWEEEALKVLPFVLAREKTPRYALLYGGIDAFNAQMTARKKNLTPAKVLQQRDRIHRKLIRYIESVPEKHFESKARFCRRLGLDTFRHYPTHTEAILKWRADKS